jgi:hypothetical protein
MPRSGGAAHAGVAATASHNAAVGRDAAEFAAWWRACSAAERRSVLANFSRRPRSRALGGACAACAECHSHSAAARQPPPAAAEDLEAMAASPEALAAWRAQHAAPPADLLARGEELCGVGGGWQKPCKLGESRECGIWAPSAGIAPHELAAFAAGADATLLEWRVNDFTAALDAYLSDRLLCKARAARKERIVQGGTKTAANPPVCAREVKSARIARQLTAARAQPHPASARCASGLPPERGARVPGPAGRVHAARVPRLHAQLLVGTFWRRARPHCRARARAPALLRARRTPLPTAHR